jgi:hypothetical protein
MIAEERAMIPGKRQLLLPKKLWLLLLLVSW